MTLLYVLIFAKVLHTIKINPKRISQTVKRESRFVIDVVTKIVQLIYTTIELIYDGIVALITFAKKNFYPTEVVEEAKTETTEAVAEVKAPKVKTVKAVEVIENDKLIDLAKYKLEKAK